MLEYGNLNKLTVLKETDIAYTLTDGEEQVFLHFNQTPNKLNIGDKVEAFLYFDQKKRLCATLEKPLITSTKPGFVKVVALNNAGCFVNIGIAKDILVSRDFLPKNEKAWPRIDEELPCIVKVKQNQLVARILDMNDKYQDGELAEKSEYDGIVTYISDNGLTVITKSYNFVFIPKSLIRKQYHIGEAIHFHTTEVKDNIMYASTILNKEKARLSDSDNIYEYLEKMGGMLPLGNLSTPDEIDRMLHMSKSAFKRAVGHLYKEQKIVIEDYKIYLK